MDFVLAEHQTTITFTAVDTEQDKGFKLQILDVLHASL